MTPREYLNICNVLQFIKENYAQYYIDLFLRVFSKST